jgi:hypothetical protein
VTEVAGELWADADIARTLAFSADPGGR